jgi:mono/diheme cytochrome c family protein
VRGRTGWPFFAGAALVALAAVLGVVAARRSDPEIRGQRLFAQHCARCHALAGLGNPQTSTAPNLDGWSTPSWIAAMMHDPDAPERFGRSPYNGGMRSIDRSADGVTPVFRDEAEERAVAWFLASQGDEPGDPSRAVEGDLLIRGERLVAERCTECHLYKGQGDAQGYSGLAPELSRYGSLAWTRAIVANPAGADTYRELALDDVRPEHMPRFDSVLSAKDIDIVARWTRSHARGLP